MTNTETNSIWMIYLFCCAGLAFSIYCSYKVFQVKPKAGRSRKDEENQIEESEGLNNQEEYLTEKMVETMEKISKQIGKGSDVFLFTEYVYLLVFVFIMALLIFFFGEARQWTAYTTISFICGALTSMLCGFIGMKIAIHSNWRTSYSAL
ncbi:MAG: hypothetical protein RIR51_1616 [Bacteroidota bacterium]